MINFNVLLAIILGFSVCLTDSQLCTIYQSNQEASFGQALVRKNYIKTRIAYYANSHSTFQLELFKAGDINPNPGPTIIDSDTSQKCKQLYYPQRTTFTGSELHRLKNITGYQRLPSDVYDKVKALGISCKPPTKRGTRGGVKTKAWLRSQLSGTRLGSVVDGNDERKKVAHCPIPVRVRPHTRNSYTHERRNGVNFENLKLVETLSNAPSPVALHLWNARSVRNKTTELYDYVLQNDVDIMVITETWLRESDPTVITELSPPDFSFHNVARHGDAHGGLGFLFRTHLDLRLKQIEFSPKTFEFACVVDRCEQYRIIAVYRPPPSTTNGFTVKAFLDEIDEFLGLCSMLGSRVIILGDFNVHVDKAHLPTPRQFLESVTSSGFSQLVEEPTHDGDHTLDLVITKTGDDIVCNYNVIDKGMSDHFVVRCNLNIQTPPSSTDRVLIKSRNYRQIDSEKFLADLSSRFADFPESDVNDMLTSLYGAVQGVLNQHCPETTRRRKQRPCAPWYDDSVMASRQLKRALESKWRKSKLVSDRQNYINQKNKLNVIIRKAKRNYYTNVILESNCRNMFSTVSSLLGRSKHVLPVSDEPLRLCNDFANFFEGKVRSIRRLLDAHPPNQQTVWTVPDPDNVPPLGPVADDDLLLALTPVSDEDVKRVIKKSANKSCDLDVMPTWLLKANSEVMVPVITSIINCSLVNGVFPDKLKYAIVFPHLKKSSLDSSELKNYRPVSNLAYISKVIELVVSSKLTAHVEELSLQDEFQSAYRRHHSTESALTRVRNDILCEIDKRRGVILVLLDLSAAFDTIDHGFLIDRLSSEFGIRDTALQWFRSYLNCRTYRVRIDSTYSDVHTLDYGVPQGSVLGPLLFTLYVKPLGRIISRYGLRYHMYADDTQIYTSFNPKSLANFQEEISKLEQCISEISIWMTLNKLKLNEGKTELLLAMSPKLRHHLPRDISINIGNGRVQMSDNVKNLGIFFQSSMSMSKQITALCKSLNFHLYNISRIKNLLTSDACHHVVRSLILSRIDYANSLLLNANVTDIQRLQRIQNRAARVVLGGSRYESASPLLKQLHWLTVNNRIIYKVSLIVYQCLNNCAPMYLSVLLHTPPRLQYNLRSSNDPTLLRLPRINSRSGECSFFYYGPKIWNTLPFDLRTSPSVEIFKKKLKTYLFNK